MQYVFAILDKIMQLLQWIPPVIDTKEQKEKARDVLDQILRYSISLRKLVNEHKNLESLAKLHSIKVAGIDDWSKKVEELFQKIDMLQQGLSHDAIRMAKFIDYDNVHGDNGKWSAMCGDMSQGMFMSGLHDEEDWLKRLKREALIERERLHEVIHNLQHVEEMQQYLSEQL
jgi:hypothetical protein